MTVQQIGSSSSPWAPLRPGLAQKHPCLWILRSLTPGGKDRSLARITLKSSHCWVVPVLNPCPLSVPFCLSLSDSCTQEIKNSCPLSCSSSWIYSAFDPCSPLFLPSLATRAAGVNEAILKSLWWERKVGGQRMGGVVFFKWRWGHRERGVARAHRGVCWGYFSVYLGWCWFVIRKKK